METLLRPAKQLAEWNSCFAKDLDKYFSLLKELQSVNFGEAALVLQNSANVYARRVEYLWDETEALNRSLSIQNEERSMEESTAKGKRNRKSKSVIDFNDFEALQLHDLVSKSNNLKEGGQKSLKLLTRRFTQLESNLAQLSTPIEILSAQGEVIGNKYDFRCNQQLTKNCMLVDELIPNDFAPETVPATPNHGTSVIPVQNQDSSFDSMFEPNQSAVSPASIAFEEMETDVNSCVNNNLEGTSNIPDETDAGYTSGDAAEDCTQTRCVLADKPTTAEAQTSTTEAQSSIIDTQTSVTEAQSSAKEAQSSAIEIQANTIEAQSTPTTDDTDNAALQPIPFEQGVPDTIPRRRTTFKLPCHISLLKRKAESRKRKNTSESKKKESLTRLLLDKYDLMHKKLKMYSPTRQLFTSPKKEELEEFQRTFDQYLKSMRGSDTYHYDAVTRGVTMELLGFQPNFTKHDLEILTDNHTYATGEPITDSNVIDEPESDLSSVPESFTTPPPTPEAANHRLNYKELVEQRMRQIGEESREQSDLEQRVAEWHKSLRPKLTAAGRRPPFHIHDYSSRILKTLEVAESKKVPFSHLVQQESAPEIARYFLASLQLANSYNVAINTSGDSGCSIELKLLDKDRNHEAFGLHEKIDRLPLSEVSNDRTMLRISTT